MSAPRASRPASRRLAPLAALAACALAACMGAGSSVTGPQSAGPAAGAQTLQEKAPARPGVPEGCTREWNNSKRDSVLYCPDLPPPSPR
jgi:hypothetical protein